MVLTSRSALSVVTDLDSTVALSPARTVTVRVWLPSLARTSWLTVTMSSASLPCTSLFTVSVRPSADAVTTLLLRCVPLALVIVMVWMALPSGFFTVSSRVVVSKSPSPSASSCEVTRRPSALVRVVAAALMLPSALRAQTWAVRVCVAVSTLTEDTMSVAWKTPS